MQSKQSPFILLSLAILLGIAAPFLFSKGMFMDGEIYAAVGKNMSDGIGNFWDPSFTKSLYFHFREHPPLAFGILGGVFKIFGDSYLIEKMVSLSLGLIQFALLFKVSKLLLPKNQQSTAWLSLFFWALAPTITWALPNNMLENFLMVYSSLCMLFYLKAQQTKRLFYLFGFGLIIILSFLTKGPVGLFPLAVPSVFFVFRKTGIKQYFSDNLLIGFFASVIGLAIYFIFPEAKTSIIEYYNKQLVPGIQSVKTVESRFAILGFLLNELLPALIFSLIIMLIRWKYVKPSFNKTTGALLFIGLAGVLPIMITFKQRPFYLIPALPFFVWMLNVFIAPQVQSIMDKIHPNMKGFKIFKWTSVVLVISVIITSIIIAPTAGRDKNKLHDVDLIIEQVGEGNSIMVHKEIISDWSLHAYLQRFGGIDMSDLKNDRDQRYLLTVKGKEPQQDVKVSKLNLNLKEYDLYQIEHD